MIPAFAIRFLHGGNRSGPKRACDQQLKGFSRKSDSVRVPAGVA
jgi:hypothetical protein